MTREQLWDAYVKRNPSFSGDGHVTMSAEGLRKLFNQTWDMAVDSQKAVNDRTNDLYNSLFGKNP